MAAPSEALNDHGDEGARHREMARHRANADSVVALKLGDGKEDAVFGLADAEPPREMGTQHLKLLRHRHQIADQPAEELVRATDEQRLTRRRQWRRRLRR